MPWLLREKKFTGSESYGATPGAPVGGHSGRRTSTDYGYNFVPAQILKGVLANPDGDGNENVTKQKV